MDDNKKSTTIWLRPSVISRMDGWLEADNCQSRSEFVDKALRFYMGYLGTEDNTTYISRAILTAIQGTLDDNNNRLCRIGALWAGCGRLRLRPFILCFNRTGKQGATISETGHGQVEKLTPI